MIISLVMPDAPLRAAAASSRARRHRHGQHEQAGQDCGEDEQQVKAHSS
jgi:hypothetical protein